MKTRYISISVVAAILVGSLMWFVNDALVDTWYLMEYPGFNVTLGEENQFRDLHFSTQKWSGESPFQVRCGPTEPSFPILDLPEPYIAEKPHYFLSGHNEAGLSSETESGIQRYDLKSGDSFDFQNGRLTSAMIRSCEISAIAGVGFSRLQGSSREHVESSLGPPVQVQRIDDREPLFRFGGP